MRRSAAFCRLKPWRPWRRNSRSRMARGGPHALRILHVHADGVQPRGAEQQCLGGAERHEDLHVPPISDNAAGGAGAEARHHALDQERPAADQHVVAYRPPRRREQPVAHPGAEHRHRFDVLAIPFGQEHAVGHRPLLDGRQVGPGGGHLHPQTQVFAPRDQPPGEVRQHGADVGDPVTDRPHVRDGEAHRLDVAPRRRQTGADLDQVGARSRRGANALAVATLHHGEQGHHGPDADGDAEHRQRGAQPAGAQQVGAQRSERGACRLQRMHDPPAARFGGDRHGQADARVVVRCLSFRISRGSGIGDDAPIEQLDAPFRPSRHVGVVGDDHYRAAPAGEVAEQAEHLVASLGIERPGGLVGQYHPAAVHQRAGDGHPLPLAAGERRRPVSQAPAHAQRLQQRLRPNRPARARQAGIARRKLDVLPRRRRAEQVVGLEHEAERIAAQGGEFVRAERAHGASGEQILAASGPVEAAENVHQRRLAGARRSHDADELARGDAQRNVGQGANGATREHAADAAHLDQRRFDGQSASPRQPPPSARCRSTTARRRASLLSRRALRVAYRVVWAFSSVSNPCTPSR